MRVTCIISFIAFVFFLMLLCISCGDNAVEKKWAVDVKTVDNVTYVQNPNQPRDGVNRFSLEEELSIGDENDDNQLFIKLRKIAVDKYGNIYVSENKPCFIRVFDANGKFIRTFGRSGEGPGEFRHISDIIIDDEREVIHVLDFKSRRISRFTFSGDRLGETKLYKSLSTQFFLDKKGFYRVFFNHGNEIFLDLCKVLKCSFDGELSTNSLILLEKKGMGIDKGPRVITIKTTLDPKGVFALNDNGDLIYGFSGDYQLTLYDNSFRKHRIIRRKVPEAKIVTEKEKDEWIEYHNKLLAKRGVKIKKSDLDFPERHRVLENIWMTSGNEILVLTCIKMNKAYIDVFNSNGIYTKKWIFTNPSDVIPIAEHFRKPIFKNQKIYAVVRHNDGLIQVKRYRIIPTPNLDTTD